MRERDLGAARRNRGAGIQPWAELPVWVPPDGEAAAVHNGDVSAIYAAGLAWRPVQETVADTWRWLQDEATRR